MKLLSTKVLIGNVFLILLTSVLILFFSFKTIRNHYLVTLDQSLKNQNTTLIYQIKPLLDEKKYDEINKLVNQIGKDVNTRITIILSDGKVIADSKFDPTKMENHSNRPEFINILKNQDKYFVRISPTLHKEMFYVALPIYENNKLIAVSRISIFLKEIDELTNAVTLDIVRITLIIIVIAFIFILIFSKNITKKLVLLSQASSKVSMGNFNISIPVIGKDEVAELTINFNNMTHKLNEFFNVINNQKEEYLNLISSIKESILLIDTNGYILLSNKSFNMLVGDSNVISKNYCEVIPSQDFNNLIQKVSRENKNLLEELNLFDTDFLVSINFIEKKNEIFILLFDISENKNLEKIKKDFVTNVSHELRTPLTAIKGYIETLEDDLEGEQLTYIEIIKRHTDRLVNIVQDLLILSELEDSSTKLLESPVNLKNLLENLIRVFDIKLKEKNISIDININQDFPLIWVDQFRIEQVFVNLIDNSIKYTEKGGIKINAEIIDNVINIILEDSGVGIPKEHLSRIFERFYTVDKSRSRKLGGTGLGLSIVKHIIMLHGGDISISSEIGIGTKYLIRIPLPSNKKSIKNN